MKILINSDKYINYIIRKIDIIRYEFISKNNLNCNGKNIQVFLGFKGKEVNI